MATKKIDPVTVITKLSEEFVADLGLKGEISVTETVEEEAKSYSVLIQGDDLGVLIGYHGETLNAAQLILSLIVSKKLGQFTRIVLDAGGWREKRAETLASMAKEAAEKAVSSGEAVALPVMSSSDRRLVHMALSDRNDVTSESEGEEGYRRVVIKPGK